MKESTSFSPAQVAKLPLTSIIAKGVSAAVKAAQAISKPSSKNPAAGLLINSTPFQLRLVENKGEPVHGKLVNPPKTVVASVLDGAESFATAELGKEEIPANASYWSLKSNSAGSELVQVYEITNQMDGLSATEKKAYFCLFIYNPVAQGIRAGAWIGTKAQYDQMIKDDKKKEQSKSIAEACKIGNRGEGMECVHVKNGYTNASVKLNSEDSDDDKVEVNLYVHAAIDYCKFELIIPEDDKWDAVVNSLSPERKSALIDLF